MLKRKVVTPPNIKPVDTRFKNINEEYLAITPAISFLESNYQKKITENTLASLCGMNPFRFSRCFKKEIGLTFQEYLVRLRIREALRLLGNPNASITDIAFTVGFNDTSYFSRTFKKYLNQSPSEFRSLQQKDIDNTDNLKNIDTLSVTPNCLKNEKSQTTERISLMNGAVRRNGSDFKQENRRMLNS